MNARRGTAAAAIGLAALAAAGCGSAGGTASGPPKASPAAVQSGARDRGPECVGSAPAHRGVEVLRGGAAHLPAGGAVSYDAARADGSSRSARVAAGRGRNAGGTAAAAGRTTWLKLHDRYTAAGTTYTVGQICTYRLVLIPSGAAAKPAALPRVDGRTLPEQCLARDRSRKEEPMRRQPTLIDGVWKLPWHLPQKFSAAEDPRDTKALAQATQVLFEDGDSGKDSRQITVTCAGETLAVYGSLHEGDRVEILGRTWRIDSLGPARVDLRPVDGE